MSNAEFTRQAEEIAGTADDTEAAPRDYGDLEADRDIQKISEAMEERDRLCATLARQVEELNALASGIRQEAQRKIDYAYARLQEYFSSVPHRSTKIQETYRLPHGTLKQRRCDPDFRRSNPELVAWLKARGMGGYVKTVENADWENLKKVVTVAGGRVVTADGEVVDGVTVEPKADAFTVEIRKAGN